MVPTLDHDIKGALGKELPDKSDAQMAKAQATVLATCAPLANFWFHLAEQELTGKPEELIPVSEVIKLTKDTLALIGNASNYISQTRCTTIVNSISKSRSKLSSFMKETCKDDLGDTELFGPEVRKKIMDRANTIDAFNKAVSKVDNPTRTINKRQFFYPEAQLHGMGVSRTIITLYTKSTISTNPDTKATKEASGIKRSFQTTNARTSYKGRTGGEILQAHTPAWHQITNNTWVLQCVQGYQLDFGDVLPQDNWPPNQPTLSFKQSMILDQEIQSLLQKNAIDNAPSTKGFFSPMFTVPKKDGSWRPIINLKHLNSFLEVPHFKMEEINSLKDVLQKDNFMGKIDLKDAYLTVPVCQQHRKFLKFHWKGQNYQFKVLPFGLATAPRVLTKILRPLAVKMRKQSIRIITVFIRIEAAPQIVTALE